jgi:hypothetical protein
MILLSTNLCKMEIILEGGGRRRQGEGDDRICLKI